MKPCPRCHSSMLQEPFTDPQGRGQRWTWPLCGEALEQYEELGSSMTPAQLDDLMQPQRLGRPRKARS